MASIDKTYTSSYENYMEFKEWASKQIVTFFNGWEECIGSYIWEYAEKDFDGRELPIMNTPNWVDIYLIQHCNIPFIQGRMKSVYGRDSYNEFKNMEFPCKLPKGFKQNRKICIKPIDRKTKFFLHKHPFSYKSHKIKWWLQSERNWDYDEESKTWTNWEMYYPHNTNTAHISSVKGVIRHLRKQYLPIGLKFILIGRYVGEEYEVTIK